MLIKTSILLHIFLTMKHVIEKTTTTNWNWIFSGHNMQIVIIIVKTATHHKKTKKRKKKLLIPQISISEMATQHKAITTRMFNGTREKIEYAYYERNRKKNL